MVQIDRLKLRELRKRAGFRQTELAEKLGISAKNISHYETGRAKPPGDTLLGFMIETGAAPAELVKKVSSD